MLTGFFLKCQTDEDSPKYLESERVWPHLKSQSRNASFSERQNENAFLFGSFLNFQKVLQLTPRIFKSFHAETQIGTSVDQQA